MGGGCLVSRRVRSRVPTPVWGGGRYRPPGGEGGTNRAWIIVPPPYAGGGGAAPPWGAAPAIGGLGVSYIDGAGGVATSAYMLQIQSYGRHICKLGMRVSGGVCNKREYFSA